MSFLVFSPALNMVGRAARGCAFQAALSRARHAFLNPLTMDEASSQHEKIREHFEQSASVKVQTLELNAGNIIKATQLIVECFQSDGKVLICGNGGSAADAQHIAAEFMNRLRGGLERPGLPAVALTTDTSFLTAYANDIGFDGVFEREVLALGRPGDVLIAISTSGRSRNVVLAVQAAKRKGMRVLALSGEGGDLAAKADIAVVIPNRDTQYIQESLLTVEHVICAAVEDAMFGKA